MSDKSRHNAVNGSEMPCVQLPEGMGGRAQVIDSIGLHARQ